MKKYLRGLILIFSLILAACSTANDSSNRQDLAGSPEMANDASQEEAANMGQNVGEDLIGEKVIKTVSLGFETLVFEDTKDFILNVVQTHQAYTEYSYESTYTPAGSFGPDSSVFKRIDSTYRVPTESLKQFMADLEGMEAVKTNEEIGSEDVTQTYRDTETRIGVLEQKEARLSELLEQAVTIEEILAIEDSLSQSIAERESLQSQLDSIDDLIDYTVVRITVLERQRLADSRGNALPFWERFRIAIMDSVFAFYYWLQDAVIVLIYALPYLIILTIAFLLFWIIKKRRNKGKPIRRKKITKDSEEINDKE